jgi:oxaloacetate decarboxylase gamma subunit
MEIHLVAESVKFMILGMMVVFFFLYFLVLLMRLQARIIARYFPLPETPVKRRKFAGNVDGIEEERRRVAAIIAAVAEHRRRAGSGKGGTDG